MKNYRVLLLFIVLFATSCSNDENTSPLPGYQPGVAITLDDDYVDEWAMAHNILKDYSWKATFFVSKINQMDAGKINKLKELRDYGHEIAGHGLNHLNAVATVNSIGFESYFNQEIEPMMEYMDANGFNVNSFAYPYGARESSLDNKLFAHFKMLRATTYGSASPAQQDCYYKNSNLVYALGIDNSYPHFSIPYFIQLLEYAKAKNKILILYAHKPVTTSTADYQTEMNTLIQICQYVKQNNMKFYRLSELYNL